VAGRANRLRISIRVDQPTRIRSSWRRGVKSRRILTDTARIMRALSIRQPYAELILRGIKTVEYRTQSINIIGERFYIYAAKKKPSAISSQLSSGKGIWSYDLSTGGPPVPQWMIELAEQVEMIEPGALLPTGVIVGSAVIEKVSQVDDFYRWHLADALRAKKLRKPKGHPQPVWFRPF
jgi:hypothetical protein